MKTTAKGALRAAMTAAVSTAVLMTALPALAQAQTAPAQQEVRRYEWNIPAQPLSRSISVVTETAGIQLFYNDEGRGRVRAPAVRGRFTVDEALARLTAGTGLTYRYSSPGVVTIEQAPRDLVIEEDGSRVLGPVRVEGAYAVNGRSGGPIRGDGTAQLGGVRGGQDEEARGYRPVVATVGGGAPVAIEEAPRSISVVTGDMMQDLDAHDIGTVLTRLPGITLRENQGERGASIYARGLSVERYQVDGGVARILDPVAGGLLNLDAYERVELVRGGNGVNVGPGSAGGSLNLVRKRPGQAETLEVSAGIGSWNRYEAQLDYQTPSVSGSPIAFRGVFALRGREAFYDNYDQSGLTLYGLVDTPLGEKARLEVGGEFSQISVNGSYSGIPHYIDGPRFNVDRDFNFTPGFTYSDTVTTNVFSKLYIDILEDLDLEVGLDYKDTKTEGVSTNYFHYFTSEGGVLYDFGQLRADFNGSHPVDFGLDAKLTGRARAFGLTHNFYVAASLDESFQGTRPRGFIAAKSLSTFDDFSPQNWVMSPTTSPLPDFRAGSTTSSAMIIGDVITWRDKVDLALTLRRDSYESSRIDASVAQSYPDVVTGITISDLSDSRNQGVDEWIPSWSVTYRPISGLSIYGSQNSGFRRQDSQYSRSGDAPNYVFEPLEPTTFENIEGGFKYSRDAWLLSVSGYKIKQENLALYAGFNGCPPLDIYTGCYITGVSTENKGIDFELVGELLPGLSAQISYIWGSTDTNAPADVPVTIVPEHEAKLFLSWTPENLQNWTFRGGARYRSSTFESGDVELYGPPPLNEPIGYQSYEFVGDAYTVFDAGVTYSLNEHIDLDLFVENVTDEEYFPTSSYQYSFPGRPRSFYLSMRWKGAGPRPADGVSPTTGLAPFGDPADWYAAFDFGQHRSRDLEATAAGKAQDGVSDVNWTFETEDTSSGFVRLGYHLAPSWRVELDAGSRLAEFGDVGGNSVAPFGVCSARGTDLGVAPFNCDDVEGEANIWSLTLNGVYDFGKETSRIRPFAGLGVGLARSSIDFTGKMEGIGTGTVPWNPIFDQPREVIGGDDARISFAWQAQAGMSYRLTSQAIIDLSYRYYSIPGMSWDTYNLDKQVGFPPSFTVGPVTPRLGEFSANYEDHSITVGLRWAFGAR